MGYTRRIYNSRLEARFHSNCVFSILFTNDKIGLGPRKMTLKTIFLEKLV